MSHSTHSYSVLCISDTSLLVGAVWNVDRLASLDLSVNLQTCEQANSHGITTHQIREPNR